MKRGNPIKFLKIILIISGAYDKLPCGRGVVNTCVWQYQHSDLILVLSEMTRLVCEGAGEFRLFFVRGGLPQM